MVDSSLSSFFSSSASSTLDCTSSSPTTCSSSSAESPVLRHTSVDDPVSSPSLFAHDNPNHHDDTLSSSLPVTSMTENIHYLSLVKLAEYSQTRTDVPIRKYVLISNMLRQQDTHPSELDDGSEVSHKDDVLEQQWFDTCLDALHTEEITPDTVDKVTHSPSTTTSVTLWRPMSWDPKSESDHDMEWTDFHCGLLLWYESTT